MNRSLTVPVVTTASPINVGAFTLLARAEAAQQLIWGDFQTGSDAKQREERRITASVFNVDEASEAHPAPGCKLLKAELPRLPQAAHVHAEGE
jgi:hypothetical protein